MKNKNQEKRHAYEDTPVSEIAEVIINKKINRIPIVNEILEVVGIVSRHDIVRSMVMEADAAAAEELE